MPAAAVDLLFFCDPPCHPHHSSPDTHSNIEAGSTSVAAAGTDGIAKHVPAAASGKTSSSKSTASPAPAAAKQTGNLQFDPLKRKKKSKGSGAGVSSSSSSSRPAITPEVQKLQEDLAQLVSDWSQGESHNSHTRCAWRRRTQWQLQCAVVAGSSCQS